MISNAFRRHGDIWNLATINANAAIRGTDTISGTAWNNSIAGGAAPSSIRIS